MGTLTFDGVHYRYGGADRDVVHDVSFTLQPGELTVLVGASGSGKSTLLRAANGIVPHLTGGTFSGNVVAAGRSIRDHTPREFADVVGFVHQDPEAQFVVDHVESDIAFVLENLGLDGAAMRRRVEEVLDALGIAHLRDRPPTSLSGGERQRCAIAGALAASPSILVLDEPTSQLDPQGADDVLAALARLNTDLGTTVLLAEHRLDRAAPLADRAMIVADGRLVADGDPATTLVTYDGAPTVTLLGRALAWNPLPLTVKAARRIAGTLERTPTPPPDLRPAAPGPTLVTVEDATVRHRTARALAGASVHVDAGEVVALLGRNGAGKSTLLRVMAGLQTTDRGRRSATGRVAYVPQEPGSLFSAATVADEVLATLRLLGTTDMNLAERWLDRMGLHELRDRHPRSLSGGERQRLAIAAVAVGAAPVLLLDEPTRGMDATSRSVLERAIAEHAAEGGAVVFATHDVELAARAAHRVVVLGDGEVVAEGSAREVLAGSLFAPQVLRVLPPLLTVAEAEAWWNR